MSEILLDLPFLTFRFTDLIFLSVLFPKNIFSLGILARETQYSTSWVSKVLDDNDWSFYLRRKTFHLDDRKRGIRKAMALQFEKLYWADPDFVSKIWFRYVATFIEIAF